MANFNRSERFGNSGRERFEGPYNRDRDFRRQRGEFPDWDRYGSYRDLGRSNYTANDREVWQTDDLGYGDFGYNDSGYRRANLLDLSVCTWPFLLPYFLPTILMSGATASGSAVGLPRISALDAGLWNFYSWGLLVMIALALFTGFGRRE